jgi:hypothetical protein
LPPLVQVDLDSLTLPNAASYLLFANVQLSNSAPLINSGTCQLVDESDLAVLASAPLPASAGSVQVSLTATDTVAAGTVVDVSCSAGINLGTITAESAGIAAIQF